MVPATARLPAPPTVRAFAPATTAVAPARKSVPASDWISVGPARVTRPLKELLPLRLRTAPVPPTPVPATESSSAAMEAKPKSSRAAPEETVVAPTAVPRAPAFETLSVPALTAMAPSKVFAPESVSLPVPFLTRLAVVPVMAPVATRLPAPSKVTTLVPATIAVALPSVKVPASDWINVSPPRVTVPPKELTPLRLRRAPVAPMPVPVTARASMPTAMPPRSSRAAPFATVVAPKALPSAVA